METNIKVFREGGTEKSTYGKMFLGSSEESFGFTLEDVVRGYGEKVYGKTAIPEGTYFWKVSYSSRFKRDMIMIYTEKNEYELINNGISFKGVRCHGGNTHKNTHGCVLVAKYRINKDLIQGTMEKELTKWAKSVGGKGIFNVINY